MEDRQQYFESLLSSQPIIAEAIQYDEHLTHLTVSSDKGLVLAERLEAMASEVAKSRAEFIRQQIGGSVAEELFETWREKWGVPLFQEKLVDVSDFRNGFMWRFRDHTTSWSENQQAQEWFLTSLEARTVTCYELWSCDEGPDQCMEELTGSYRQILEELLAADIYEVLISPVFTTAELSTFIEEFDKDEHDFTLEEIIEDYISRNPNFVAE
ncbi:hypothetical protein [Hymenobacter yonginensis]|uniref:Uncharacterized protein n=1 Tax=Hymenobacter yonginensis TaxID=748197 RepID=A0ABY7PLD1_9BACT|nr:hypothetical protein [Hymenobacter yonginensis]WBO83591.1 hypothetical protein O9Z63_14530 [Hymenobacter yonginensis]